MEPPGAERHGLYKRAKKLYDARSDAAHEARPKDAGALVTSYALVKKVLVAIIEAEHVPPRDELEARLFGA